MEGAMAWSLMQMQMPLPLVDAPRCPSSRDYQGILSWYKVATQQPFPYSSFQFDSDSDSSSYPVPASLGLYVPSITAALVVSFNFIPCHPSPPPPLHTGPISTYIKLQLATAHLHTRQPRVSWKVLREREQRQSQTSEARDPE